MFRFRAPFSSVLSFNDWSTANQSTIRVARLIWDQRILLRFHSACLKSGNVYAHVHVTLGSILGVPTRKSSVYQKQTTSTAVCHSLFTSQLQEELQSIVLNTPKLPRFCGSAHVYSICGWLWTWSHSICRYLDLIVFGQKATKPQALNTYGVMTVTHVKGNERHYVMWCIFVNICSKYIWPLTHLLLGTY